MAFSFKDLNKSHCSENYRTLSTFSRAPFTTIIPLREGQSSITQILSSTIDCVVDNVKLINTPIAISFEGQTLTGYKLLVDLSIFQKIIYSSCDDYAKVSSVLKHVEHKSIYVVLPATYNGHRLCDLIRNNKFIINPIVEDSSIRIKNPYELYSYTSLILDVQLY